MTRLVVAGTAVMVALAGGIALANRQPVTPIGPFEIIHDPTSTRWGTDDPSLASMRTPMGDGINCGWREFPQIGLTLDAVAQIEVIDGRGGTWLSDPPGNAYTGLWNIQLMKPHSTGDGALIVAYSSDSGVSVTFNGYGCS